MSALTESTFETEMILLDHLSAMNHEFAEVADILEATDFSDVQTAMIYQHMVEKWESDEPFNHNSMFATLPDDLAALFQEWSMCADSNTKALLQARRIKDASTRRSIVARCKQTIEEAEKKKGEIGDILADAQTRMYAIENKEEKTTVAEDFIEIQRMSEVASKSKYGTVGVPTMFKSLDDITGGLKKQDLIVIGARPSIGKTALATNIFQNIIESTEGFNVMFFSGEMSRHQLLLRMASRRTRIDNNALARGNLSPADWVAYTKACGELSELMEDRAWIDDKSRPSPSYIKAVATQKIRGVGLDVIFVDYLNIMSIRGRYESNVTKLSEISGAMKALAKDLDIPVVLLAQLNRGAEQRDEAREPMLSDLKGSGSIEEDSDIVLFPHRAGRMALSGKLLVAKHRNGPLDNIPLTYEGHLTSFRER